MPRQVGLNRRLWLATLIGGLLFLWPLLVYGPSNFQDSASYYKGGQVAVSFALQKLHLESAPSVPEPSVTSPGGPKGATPDAAPQQVRGARSVAYSVAAYVLGAPRPEMWLLAVAQALVTAFTCAVALFLFAGDLRTTAAKLAALAFATPIAFACCQILPDIFAALTILVIALLVTSLRSLSVGVRIALVLVGAGAITFHASDLPIALGVTALGGALMLISTFRKPPAPHTQWAYVVAPLALGVAVTMGLNSVAFGGASLTGKRYPLTLARSVAEGPAKWYLDQNCGHLKYAICEVFPHGVPGTINGFLWGKTGVKEKATPQQLDRIRDEEAEVVVAATRAYPWVEIKKLSSQFGRQLIHFEPGEGLGQRLVYDSNGGLVAEFVPFDPTWVGIVKVLTYASVMASSVLLLFRWRTRPEFRSMITLVIFGILLNAAICVYFSGVTARYQARVIWLIPLLALMALGPVGRRAAADQAECRA